MAPSPADSAQERRENFASRGPTKTPPEADHPPPPPSPARASNASKLPERRRLSQRPGFSERRRTSVIVGQRSIDFLAETHPEEKGPKFVTFIIKLYRRWGYFIVDHDWQAIVICIIISLLSVGKVLLTPQVNDITGYSPYGARARTEHSRYQEFFAHDGLGLAVYVFALAKDGGTMLRTDHLKEVVEILDFTSSNFSLYNRGTNESKTFNDFCISFCQINEPVRQFYNGFTIQNDLANKGQQLNGRLLLKYPISSIFGRQLSLQNNFYGIELFNESSTTIIPETEEFNETTEGLKPEDLEMHVTNMKSVKMIVLQFRAEHELGWNDKDVKDYEMQIVNYFEKEHKSKKLKIYTLSTSYVEEEMVRAGVSLVPYLSVGFLIMCTCACVSVVLRAIYEEQHSLPKVLLAIAACILPFMSCATALAIMFLCGMRFASILCVIPFLVLAIGVDSSYLMIHEWQRVIQQCRSSPNRRNSQIGYRIAEVLSEVGPAILISALTNILADAVGSFTSSPEITLLCVGNLASMAVAFVYQMTCYTGLMSLIGRYEIKVERKERNKAEFSLKDKKVNISKHNQLTRQHSKFHEETKEAISKTMWIYVNIIANKFIASFIVFLYFAYLAFSIFGITQININLSTQKLFSMDSPLLELDKLRVKYQVPHYTMATVFVNNPGNFTNTSRLLEMNQFVADMESIKGSWGPVGTKYFMRDFLQFENSFEEFGEEEPPIEPLEDEEANENSTVLAPKRSLTSQEDKLAHLYDNRDLETFIAWPEYSFWSGFIRIKNDTLEKFFFTTAYHGEQLSIWTERGKLLNEWRSVVDKYYPQFDSSVFHEDGVFLDLIDNMPTDTWQSVLGAIVCMGIVCYIFLNSWFAVTIATTAVLSICTGILGLISWWGIDLDPISMAAMIICVGSSCDLPAHTSFHYYLATVRGKNSSPQEKLANCLSTIAFPALQAAISMILCVSSLLLVHLYMSSVFVKTMTLCVILCNIHALVFIPAFLVLFDYATTAVLKSGQTDKIQPGDSDMENGRLSKLSRNSLSGSQSLPVANGRRTPSPNPIAITSASGNHLDIPPQNVIAEKEEI